MPRVFVNCEGHRCSGVCPDTTAVRCTEQPRTGALCVQACATEREVFCSDMPTGQARVFRCLVHNLGKADFGKACKEQVMKKLARRQQNWKLDVTLRKACKEDAANVCEDVDHDQDHAEITRCLMKNHDSISEPCQHEVRYIVVPTV